MLLGSWEVGLVDVGVLRGRLLGVCFLGVLIGSFCLVLRFVYCCMTCVVF